MPSVFEQRIAARFSRIPGVLTRDLRIREAGACVVLNGGPHAGGAYDASGKLLEESQLLRARGNGAHPLYPVRLPEHGKLAQSADESAYMGPLFWHYGHFLLESLARAWCADALPANVTLAWSCATGIREPKEWQLRLLERMFPGRRLSFVSQPTRFARLAIPEPAFQIGWAAHPSYVAPFERLAASVQPAAGAATGERLYLTRAHLAPVLRLISGERAIETMFANDGFRVFAPEQHPMDEQIRAFARADLICGFIGTAFHNVLYSRRGIRSVLFSRGQPNFNYVLIDKLKSIDATYVDAGLRAGWDAAEDAAVADHEVVRDILPDFDELRRALTVMGLQHPLADAATRERIRTLALLQHRLRLQLKLQAQKTGGAATEPLAEIESMLAECAKTISASPDTARRAPAP